MTELERLVAKVMSSAFIEPVTALPKKAKAKKKTGLAKKMEAMTEEQKKLLFALLNEKLSLIVVHNETYAYRRAETGDWIVRSMADGEPEHTVLSDFSACSCQDNRFRGRVCKHMTALKEVLT